MKKYSPLSRAALSTIQNLPSDIRCLEEDERCWYMVTFPNEFGALIAKDRESFGQSSDLFELTVLLRGKVCRNSPITKSLKGCLTEQEVVEACKQISNLSLSDLSDGEVGQKAFIMDLLDQAFDYLDRKGGLND